MEDVAEKLRVGYIGLGDIGAPMAERIVDHGFPLVVWNRTAAKMAPLAAKGAGTAGSAVDVAGRCDMLFLCVDTAEAIEEILFGAAGVVAAADQPRLVVDNSTMHPHYAQRIAARLGEAGIAMIDAPVSGGPVGARAGTLAAMVGGDAADVGAARPVIMTYAGRMTQMGPIGSGQATKACNQIINFTTIAGIAEALAFGANFGLEVSHFPAAIAGGFADSNMLREYQRATLAGEDGNVTFLINGLTQLFQGSIDPRFHRRLDVLLKDLGIALDCARAAGSAMPVSGLLDSLFRMLHFQPAPNSEVRP